MTEPIELQIVNKIKKAKRGTAFFADDFLSFGNAKTINKCLERLVNTNELYRVSRGIYIRPKNDRIVGLMIPGIDEIAIAIAKRDRARILPTGSFALFKLGLTTQVPLNIVYYTDTSARKIKVGNFTITFKKTSAKNLSRIGSISKLAIQALKEIGEGKVTKEEIIKIVELLREEKSYHLEHDLKLAPKWIKNLLEGYMKENINE
jgi:hypothetical protein